jgi:hypothetical protein
MSDLNWIGKMILVIGFAVSFLVTQGIMDQADASTLSGPQATAAHVIMSDSTPLVYPSSTNAVTNPTSDWGGHDITMREVSFLMTPHEYRGKRVCIVDPLVSGAPILVCEAVLNHGRKETLRVVSDAVWLFPFGVN